MAKALAFSTLSTKFAFCFLFLALIFGCAYSARFLDEIEAQPQVVADTIDEESNMATPPVTAISTLPSGQIPTVVPPDETQPPVDDVAAPIDDATPPIDDVAAPISNESPLTNPAPAVTTTTATITTPPNVSPTVTNSGITTVGSPFGPPQESTFSFFMHDILGGSHPSARVVSGMIANSEINGIPFSKTNNNFFPISGGSPLLNLNNIDNLINPNTAPLLTGLNGAKTNTIVQNAGNNIFNSNNQPFVTGGQLPPGPTLQRLMFGSITVFDDELTEGHELGSAVIGRAQGFYLASSLDGTSQTIALTVLLHSDHDPHGVEDTISFFGVHRTVSHESQIAVVGGTGKYENANGYATVETLHDQEDQHTTDGVDTILHFNVYIS